MKVHAAALILVICVLFPGFTAAETKVLMLGTGTPVMDASRAGASVAIIHAGKSYVFDIGAGSVRNIVRAREALGIKELGTRPLDPPGVCCLFLTHLHSDHTLDYVELVNTLWWRRDEKLRAFGPSGLQGMSEGMYQLMAKDVKIRTSGLQPVKNPDFYRAEVTEIKNGFVFEEQGIRVEAFDVPHGDIKPAFAYKITTPDKSIVISGDTAYSEVLLEKAKGVDLLIHEVISEKGLSTRSEFWQNYHRAAHTPASELGKLASKANPGLLVLYHALFYGVSEKQLLDELLGKFGKHLDV